MFHIWFTSVLVNFHCFFRLFIQTFCKLLLSWGSYSFHPPYFTDKETDVQRGETNMLKATQLVRSKAWIWNPSASSLLRATTTLDGGFSEQLVLRKRTFIFPPFAKQFLLTLVKCWDHWVILMKNSFITFKCYINDQLRYNRVQIMNTREVNEKITIHNKSAECERVS